MTGSGRRSAGRVGAAVSALLLAVALGAVACSSPPAVSDAGMPSSSDVASAMPSRLGSPTPPTASGLTWPSVVSSSASTGPARTVNPALPSGWRPVTPPPTPTTTGATARHSAVPSTAVTAATPVPSSTAISSTGPSSMPAFPAGTLIVTEADLATAAAAVAKMSTADKAGSVVMASSADAVGTDLVARLHLGGVILMGSRGIVDGTRGGTPAQVANVTAELQKQAADDPSGGPLLIATDQEYGDVTRLVNGFTTMPGASRLASIPDTAIATALTQQVAAAAAAEMLAVGISVDFAPVSDILPVDGASAIGDRSYGSDPQRVAKLVAAAVRGYQGAGVAATLKHFPGLGRVATDTHAALPTLSASCQSWNSHEAVPIRAGVDAGAALVMTGHVRLPAVGDDDAPASLNADVVTDLLRGKGRDGCAGLGFTGVTVSDSLQMAPVANNFSSGEAAVQALNAGEDLLLMPVRPAAAVSGIADAVKSGALPASRLDDAATRVLALRLATARIPRPSMDVIDSAAHRSVAAQAIAAAG